MFGPTSTIPPLPFSEFVLFYSLVLRTLLAWYGTFLTKHRTLPPPPHRPRRECDYSTPCIGLDGLVSLPFRPTTTIHSTPPTKRKPRTFHAGHRLGWARPPLPPAPCATILPRTTPSATSAAAGHKETPSTPSPPQHPRRVSFRPRDRRRFASQLREWRRGHWRSSWIGFQAALRSLHRPPLAPPF